MDPEHVTFEGFLATQICVIQIMRVLSLVELLLCEIQLQTEASELCDSCPIIIARQRGPLGI